MGKELGSFLWPPPRFKKPNLGPSLPLLLIAMGEIEIDGPRRRLPSHHDTASDFMRDDAKCTTWQR